MQELSIEINNLNKSFNKNKVLIDLNCKFEKGNIYFIKGQNGSGKTTLFKILLGLINYDSGVINNPMSISGLVEEASGYGDMSAINQLKYLLGNSPEISKKITELAKRFNIEDALTKRFSELSLGMKQKIMLIYAFLVKCECLLLDEPTNSLDSETCKTLTELIIEKKKENKIIIICSHDSYFYSVFDDSKNLELRDGKLIPINRTLISVLVKSNKDLSKYLIDNNIKFNNLENEYYIDCNKSFFNDLVILREEYEITDISFR